MVFGQKTRFLHNFDLITKYSPQSDFPYYCCFRTYGRCRILPRRSTFAHEMAAARCTSMTLDSGPSFLTLTLKRPLTDEPHPTFDQTRNHCEGRRCRWRGNVTRSLLHHNDPAQPYARPIRDRPTRTKGHVVPTQTSRKATKSRTTPP